jgi:hypothetical protein
VRLGEPSKNEGLYLLIVDLDIRRLELADEAWAALLALWPTVKLFPSVISGSGGESRHLYFLTDKPFRKSLLAKSKGDFKVEVGGRTVTKRDWEVELMGTGSQAVVPPSIHPDTRQPYVWERPLELDLPVAMYAQAALVEGWGGRQVAAEDEDDLFALVRTEPMDLTDEQIRAILAHIPNDGAGAHYDDYVQVGMALHHQFQGAAEGFEHWCDWARRSEKFDEKNALQRWKSFKTKSKNPVRMATLIQIARANNWSPNGAPDLDLDEKGRTKKTASNCRLISEGDPATAGCFGFDEFRERKSIISSSA